MVTTSDFESGNPGSTLGEAAIFQPANLGELVLEDLARWCEQLGEIVRDPRRSAEWERLALKLARRLKAAHDLLVVLAENDTR